MTRSPRQEAGGALLLALLGILVFVSVGALIIVANDRNTDLRFAYQRGIVGFHSAEAGVHLGAVAVQNAMQNFALPTNCSAAGTSFSINGRTVTYTLSVPTGSPWNGVAGSCAENPLNITEAQGTTFGGLNSQLYTYNLTSSAANALGFTEATVNSQFQAHQIPMFQFAGFYAGDLELEPGPHMVINGRLHTNRDMYLNSGNAGGTGCGAAPNYGLNILGQITIVGSGLPGTAPLNRGFKNDLTTNNNNVYISLDGTTSSMQVLGADAQGSTSCATTTTRQIGASEIISFDTLGPRIVTNIKNITLPALPNPSGWLCVPWITGCGSTGGSYWQNANLRIALDTTQKVPLAGALCSGPGQVAPCLYPVQVLNADGTPNAGLTVQLKLFLQTKQGAITYSDVPVTSGNKWDCLNKSNCESKAFADGSQYTTQFPQGGQLGCGPGRNPRDQITPVNFCNDYRYGGFYNWREEKPILMLNIDWMALEEYNNSMGGIFFNPNTNTNGGLIVFLTVRDTAGTEGLKATNYGVRIFDAGRARRNLTDPGVTFATDQAMYVTGNFNCPVPTLTGPTTSPAPCGDGSWPPTSSSTYQKPTSIAADTINVLSCAWIQSKACVGPGGTGFSMNLDQWAGVGQYRPLDEWSTTCTGSTYGCPAQATIVNAGFYSGVDQSWCPSNSNGTNCGSSYYSGGLENYPRLHEDWSGINFWYQGSFVASGPPNHTCFEYHAQLVAIADDLWTCTLSATQGFRATQRYGAPQRRWFYDVSFNNASYLPPLTPRFVYLSLVYFTQVFQ